MAAAFVSILESAMKLERDVALNASPFERTAERRGDVLDHAPSSTARRIDGAIALRACAEFGDLHDAIECLRRRTAMALVPGFRARTLPP
jgi:hypothetical protein